MLLILDGIDAAGKSTVAKELVKAYGEDNSIIIHFPSEDIKPKAEDTELVMQAILLYLQDMVDVMNNKIFPALKEGKIVIVDRMHFSTGAYQGLRLNKALRNAENAVPKLFSVADFVITRTIGELLVKEINATGITQYDKRFHVFHITMDIDVDKALERCKERNSGEEKYEKDDKETWELRRKYYLSFARASEIMDAILPVNNKTPEELAKEITRLVEDTYKNT